MTANNRNKSEVGKRWEDPEKNSDNHRVDSWRK